MTTEHPRPSEEVIAMFIIGVIVGTILSFYLSSCHPYPYPTVKNDKNAKAQFR